MDNQKMVIIDQDDDVLPFTRSGVRSLLREVLMRSSQMTRCRVTPDPGTFAYYAEARLPEAFEGEARGPALAAVDDAFDRVYGLEGHPHPMRLIGPYCEWTTAQVEEMAELLEEIWAERGVQLEEDDPLHAGARGAYLDRARKKGRTPWLADPMSRRWYQVAVRREGDDVEILTRELGSLVFTPVDGTRVDVIRHAAHLLEVMDRAA